MAETLASFDPATAGQLSTQGVSPVGKGWSVRLGRAYSTLLGPEGTTGRPCGAGGCCFRTIPGMTWSHIPLDVPVTVVGVWCGAYLVVGWLLVENCTVDASILFSVVKLSRANGGCLGTRSR